MIGGTVDAENAGWSNTVLSASLTFVLTIALTSAACAQTGEGVQGGLISGFTHPLFGWNHVVAMVAVGLWGVFLGRPAIWILPVVFPLAMAFT